MKRDPCGFLKAEYQELVDKSFNWQLRTLEGPSAPRAKVEGRKVIVLCSNNYLNLSNHPKLKEAAKKAVDSHGAGSGSVRAIAGNMDLHLQLEKKIAEFKHREAALYYQTGFAANAGLLPQLVGEGDAVLTDELNHGSIIDGLRLTKAKRAIYPHNDLAGLESALKQADAEKARRIMIVSDGVFSMDGDLARAPDICRLAEDFGAMTYFDDAHGEGVLGGGRGIGTHFNVEGKIHVEMGTFSKAFGVVGGLIAGSQGLVNFAYNKSRTWLLSGSAPPATAAACMAALDVLEKEPEHVKRLWENTAYFKKEMQGMGFDCGHSETPITPVMLGESALAKKMSERMFQEGVFALPIVFPMVAKDKARIRTIMNAGLTKDDLNEALRAFEKVGKELKAI
ncbi:MAG: glycine C-acetyltransferase [Euryarchaeota archaeon]|nr:glycine C-acetyltransferase [Euryarchaeota archaeon]